VAIREETSEKLYYEGGG
jgi:hypothetical protein